MNRNNKIKNLLSYSLKNGLKKELNSQFQIQTSPATKLKKKPKQMNSKLMRKKRSKLEIRSRKNKYKFNKIKQTDFVLMQTVNFLESEEKKKTLVRQLSCMKNRKL